MAEHMMQIKLDEAEYTAISDAAQANGVDLERYILDSLMSVVNPPVRSGVANASDGAEKESYSSRRKVNAPDEKYYGPKLEGQDSSAESDVSTH